MQSTPEQLRLAGFRSHHTCEKGTTAYDLAARAVAGLGDLPSPMGAILWATCLPANATMGDDTDFLVSGDVKDLMRYPASRLQAELGLDDAMVVGVGQQACTGLLGTLRLARSLLLSEPDLDPILCLTADRFPHGASYEQAYNLVSDGAVACTVSAEPGPFELLGVHQLTHGGLAYADDDQTVGAFFTHTCTVIERLCDRLGVKPADIDWLVPQNTNVRVAPILARMLDIAEDRVHSPSAGGRRSPHRGRRLREPPRPARLGTDSPGPAGRDAHRGLRPQLAVRDVRGRGLTVPLGPGRRASSQRGSHQFRSPSSTSTAGTSISRTTVASSSIATARPNPIAWMGVRLVRAKPVKTTTMIAAAVVMMPAVEFTARMVASSQLAPRSRSGADLGQQEDLVVHREAEEDAEQEERQEYLDEPRRGHGHQAGAVSLLEDEHQDAVRREHRKEVGDHRLRGDQNASEGEQEQGERQPEHPGDHEGDAAAHLVIEVDVLRRLAADEDAAVLPDKAGQVGAEVFHQRDHLVGLWPVLGDDGEECRGRSRRGLEDLCREYPQHLWPAGQRGLHGRDVDTRRQASPPISVSWSTTSIGLAEPPPKPAARRSAATRGAASSGSMAGPDVPSFIESAGAARTSSTRTAAGPATQGLRIGQDASRGQRRRTCARGVRSRPSSTWRPRRHSTAGSRVSADIAATPTATMAPSPIDR